MNLEVFIFFNINILKLKLLFRKRDYASTNMESENQARFQTHILIGLQAGDLIG